MPEEDGKIFGEAYQIYEKWRSVVIDGEEQWTEFIRDVHGLAARYDGNRLALRLAVGIADTFDDLYRNGAKPPMPDYFGRSDL